MIFFKVPKVVPRLNLTIAGNPIEQVNEFNFLGITFDQNITLLKKTSETKHMNKCEINYQHDR